MSDIFRDYSFGGWLRTWRIEKQITLREMSRRFDMQPSQYCKIEKSELDPPNTRERLMQLTKPLELNEERFEMLVCLSFQHHLCKLKERFK